jgi:Domain of unknown function (DUF4326)
MPQRIQLKRTKGWRKPAGAIVVARPSKWGNPFKVDVFGELALELFENTVNGVWDPGVFIGSIVTTRGLETAYAAYRAWLRRIDGHPVEMARTELRGHDLCCWCPLDQPCHADVLLEVAANA